MDLTPPPSDVIEVSLFGPGYGECVLIHIGNGKWIIVDSCIDKETKQPIVLEYLKNLSVDIKHDVELIIATHWHDDHIRGLSKIVQECEKAQFVCTEAQKSRDFLCLVNASKENIMTEYPGLKEFATIFDILKVRGSEIMLAIENRRVYQSKINQEDVVVYTLSPSDAAIIESKNEIAKLIPTLKSPKNSFAELSTNFTSIVLLFIIGKDAILLGADLEETAKNPGWSKIVSSQGRVSQKASYFKIPHHGSKSSQQEIVWKELLKDNPVSTITPFLRGQHIIPQNSDLEYYKGKTDKLFITTKPETKKVKGREHAIKKLVSKSVISIVSIPFSRGFITARKNVGQDEWNVLLHGEAIRV